MPSSFNFGKANPVISLVEALEAGQIVALPTDTVPGLAIRADAPNAAATLSSLKGYESARPFSLHFANLSQCAKMAPSLPPGLAYWLQKHLAQGVTAVIPASWMAIPQSWHWSWPSVGLRLPQNHSFSEVAEQLQAPLLMTSINPVGEPPLFGSDLRAWLEEREILTSPAVLEMSQRSSSVVVEFSPLPQLRRGSLPTSQLSPGLRILVLCSGNICRSPVAEAMLRAELAAAWGVQQADLEELGWHIASAGTFAMPDGPASECSITVAADVGLDISQHRSANLEDLLHEPWDLILGMGRNHLAALPKELPQDLFDPSAQPVPDPFGGPLEAYQHMRDHLQAATQERVLRWSQWAF